MDYILPWTEKYRPQSINEIIGQDKTINSLKNIIKRGSLPHLLFYGCSGTGKTSTITTMLKDFYGNKKKLMVMKLDASDDRGINAVREEIKVFAKKKSHYPNVVKVIILDEADSMTFDAQFALRRIIEKYSSSTRFCLICNYDNKIIPAIKSRCIEFKFNPITERDMVKRLKYIAKEEKIKVSSSILKVIYKVSQGDLRKGINILQSVSLNNITSKKSCYKIMGYPTEEEIQELINVLVDDTINFNDSLIKVNDIILANGYSINIILKELSPHLISMIDDEKRYASILSNLADLDCKSSKSTFTDIYSTMLVSIFKTTY